MSGATTSWHSAGSHRASPTSVDSTRHCGCHAWPPRHHGPGGRCRARRRLDRRLPAAVARRLAAHRPDRRHAVGRRRRPSGSAPARRPGPVRAGDGMTALEVLATGALTTVQDLGRPRLARLGVPQSGPSTAARCAGEPARRRPVGAAGLECVLGGLRCAHPVRHRSVTGADLHVDVAAVRSTADAARLAPRRCGWDGPRKSAAYVAVRGGVAVPAELGRRSYDALSHLGPPPLAVGDSLPTGTSALWDPVVDHSPEPPLPVEPVLRVRLGPRADHLTESGLAGLLHATWTVSPASDRVSMGSRVRPAARRGRGRPPERTDRARRRPGAARRWSGGLRPRPPHHRRLPRRRRRGAPGSRRTGPARPGDRLG